MPIYLDVHKVPFKEEQLKELVHSPKDEFGVSHVNLFYNHDANVCFCLLDAPDEEAVIKHHDKVGINCEWITKVTMATGREFFPAGLASFSSGER
ncbi:MAG: nickel-binding protein [Nitrososphaeraceae archaeon]